MTHYDIIKINSSLFALLVSAKVSLADVQYLEMYERFVSMQQEGYKYRYIVTYLAQEFHLTSRGVEKIVNRMQRKLNL